MAEGKQREAWNHTSHLLAMLDNRLAFGKKEPSKPADFHPFLIRKEKEESIPNPLGIQILKIFLPPNDPNAGIT